jgi:hypothetical protein
MTDRVECVVTPSRRYADCAIIPTLPAKSAHPNQSCHSAGLVGLSIFSPPPLLAVAPTNCRGSTRHVLPAQVQPTMRLDSTPRVQPSQSPRRTAAVVHVMCYRRRSSRPSAAIAHRVCYRRGIVQLSAPTAPHRMLSRKFRHRLNFPKQNLYFAGFFLPDHRTIMRSTRQNQHL